MNLNLVSEIVHGLVNNIPFTQIFHMPSTVFMIIISCQHLALFSMPMTDSIVIGKYLLSWLLSNYIINRIQWVNFDSTNRPIE